MSRGPFIVDPRVQPASLVEWWQGRDRGMSSEAIAMHYTFGAGSPCDHPWDPDDFGRCERLLRTVPVLRAFLPQMAAVSPVWAALVARWDDLVALCESEAPRCFDTPNPRGSAPMACELMRHLIDGARRQ